MTPGRIRMVVVAVCAVGIAGMIGGSVADDNAVALTFGLITAAAVACLIVATAVAGPPPGESDDVAAERLEARVAGLVANGADEAAVRALVREAVDIGRRRAGKRAGEVGAGVHGGRTPRPDRRTFT